MTRSEIKELRKSTGLSQKDFGEMIGCGKSTVSDWENGKAIPSAENHKELFRIRREYGKIKGVQETLEVNDLDDPMQELARRAYDKLMSIDDADEFFSCLNSFTKFAVSTGVYEK